MLRMKSSSHHCAIEFSEQSRKREKLELVDTDRIAIYLELMDSYQQLGQAVCSLKINDFLRGF